MSTEQVTTEYVARLEGALTVLERSYEDVCALAYDLMHRLDLDMAALRESMGQLKTTQDEILAVVAAPDGTRVWDFRTSTRLS